MNLSDSHFVLPHGKPEERKTLPGEEGIGKKVIDYKPLLIAIAKPHEEIPALQAFFIAQKLHRQDTWSIVFLQHLERAKSDLLSLGIDFSDVPFTEANQQAISTFLKWCFSDADTK